MPIFYVRPINGDDTNDGLSFVNAFKTTQQAILGVTTDTGDEQIFLCNEGIEDVTEQVNLLRDHTINAAANANFYGCRFTGSALKSGARNGGYNTTYYYACEFDNNPEYGYTISGGNRGTSKHVNCSYHDNGDGALVGNNVDLFNCKIYDNTTDGIVGYGRYNSTFEMHSSVVYNNGRHGYYVNNSSDSTSSNKFINNVIVNNGGYGVESNTTEFESGTVFIGNILTNNTSGSYNFTSVTHPPTGARSLEYTDANVSNADFDSATGKFNSGSEAVDAMFPFGGAPGSVSREGFSVTDSGSLSLGTGDVGDIVNVSGNSFQLVQENPRVWKNV